MTDDVHPDLAALTPPAELAEHERLHAASARLARLANVRGLPPGACRPVMTLATALNVAADIHRDESGGCAAAARGVRCIPSLMADAILGDEARR